MYVTYFDEVKAVNEQTTYWVGGISVAMDQIQAVEAKVSELAQELFGSIELTPATEFHGTYVYFGKGPFKGMSVEKRIEVLARLADILSDSEVVKRVYAAIDTTKLYAPEKAASFAFAHFCERVQMLVGGKQKTLLIGDLDNDESKNMIREFAQYRANGTPWEYGIEVKSIVDSVHFAKSHHSRMIQLADVYLFLTTHSGGSRKGWMAPLLTEAIKGKELWPHRYKDWPK